MNDQQLQQLVEEISIRFFDLPFKHKATFNKRLRTTGGRYLLHSSNIEINPKHYELFGEEELIGIIKHELCHYHLHLQGKGYLHRDQDFKQLLKQVGGSRFCKSVKTEEKKQKIKHVYVCTNCSLTYYRVRQINTNRYVCGRCKGKLKKSVDQD